jgi:hypothetical protein
MYLALEGGAGIRNRFAAARDHMQLTPDTPLALIQSPIDLCKSGADYRTVINTIRQVESDLGRPVTTLVIDTLARAMAGGNENGPEDMGALIGYSDKIRHETGVCIIFIHHSGKEQARGARGHNSLKGACDTEIEVTKAADLDHVAHVIRQRDLESGQRFMFKLHSIEVGTNARGKPVTTCVVDHVEGPASKPVNKIKLTEDETIAYRALVTAISDCGALQPVLPDGATCLAVTEEDWRVKFYDIKVGAQDTKKKAFQRVTKSLTAKAVIGTKNDLIWPLSTTSDRWWGRDMGNRDKEAGHGTCL